MRAEVKQELDRIKGQSSSGKLMIDDVIKAAQSKRNPLHNEFTWDLQDALRKNLRNEARDLIREYHIVIITPQITTTTRHFVSLSSDRINGGGYRNVQDVLSDEVAREQLLQDALLELESFRARYQRLTELRAVFDAVEEVASKRPRQQKPQRRQTRVERAAV